MNPKSRSLFLAMASRRARPGTGSGPALLRERTSAYGTPDLKFLEMSIPFVVVGGLATRLYMPERMTLDTDILVLPDDVSMAEAALIKAGATKEGPLAIGGSAWRLSHGGHLDLVALDEPWTEEAVRHPVRGQDGLPYIQLPFLVLMKLSAGRMQDLTDISRMLGGAEAETLDPVVAKVGQYRPQDLEDLKSLVRLGKLEYEQPVNP
ncbi:MAG: hypothetical protein U1E27_07120 [Kiritimatiellia bacterium]|nr:hypothetical protein [Kiritimatiellia bacterium]